jgi:hypothetical protein
MQPNMNLAAFRMADRMREAEQYRLAKEAARGRPASRLRRMASALMAAVPRRSRLALPARTAVGSTPVAAG